MTRPASTAEIMSNLSPAFIATLSAAELLELFPFSFEDLDPLQAPEPASLALLLLPSGPAAVVYGKVTGTITVSLPDDDDARQIFHELIDEVPLGDRIQWLRDDLRAKETREDLAQTRVAADTPGRKNDAVWDQAKGNWHQFKGTVKAKWNDLTDDEIEQMSGDREQIRR